MSKKEKIYRETLIRYAQGQATREDVRAVDPMRRTIQQSANMAAKEYARTAKGR